MGYVSGIGVEFYTILASGRLRQAIMLKNIKFRDSFTKSILYRVNNYVEFVSIHSWPITKSFQILQFRALKWIHVLVLWNRHLVGERIID